MQNSLRIWHPHAEFFENLASLCRILWEFGIPMQNSLRIWHPMQNSLRIWHPMQNSLAFKSKSYTRITFAMAPLCKNTLQQSLKTFIVRLLLEIALHPHPWGGTSPHKCHTWPYHHMFLSIVLLLVVLHFIIVRWLIDRIRVRDWKWGYLYFEFVTTITVHSSLWNVGKKPTESSAMYKQYITMTAFKLTTQLHKFAPKCLLGFSKNN